MGKVIELGSVKRKRRVDDLCKAVAADFCGVETIEETVVVRLGELNFHWSADEAEEFACDVLKAVSESRKRER